MNAEEIAAARKRLDERRNDPKTLEAWRTIRGPADLYEALSNLESRLEEIERLRGQIDTAQRVLRKIEALHPERTGYCNTCGGQYPCLTVSSVRAYFEQA